MAALQSGTKKFGWSQEPAAEPRTTGTREEQYPEWSVWGNAARSITTDALPESLRKRLEDTQANVSGLFTDADGGCVLFGTDTDLVELDRNGESDVYLYDAWNDSLDLVSATTAGMAGNGASTRQRMDGSAESVVFQSEASNLVGDDRNNTSDIFLWSAATWSIERVSWTPENREGQTGAAHPALDAAGAHNLYDRADPEGFRQIYAYDRGMLIYGAAEHDGKRIPWTARHPSSRYQCPWPLHRVSRRFPYQ